MSGCSSILCLISARLHAPPGTYIYRLDMRSKDQGLYRQVKRALGGEVDGKLHIAVHARMYVYIYMSVYTYMPYVHSPGVHGRFYGLDLKKGSGRIGKQSIEVVFYPEVRSWGGEQSAAILVSRPNYSRMLKYFLGIIVWHRDYSIAI